MSDSLIAADMTEEEFLAQYHQSDYPRPSFTADVALFCKGQDGTALKLLLVKRGGHPYRGCWALPGGFVEPEEDADITTFAPLPESTVDPVATVVAAAALIGTVTSENVY